MRMENEISLLEIGIGNAQDGVGEGDAKNNADLNLCK